jgi:plasmid stabilization system protein ParE
MKIVLSPRALMNLDDISAYLLPRSERGARRVGFAIEKSLGLLVRHPRSGRKQTASNVRKIVVKK